MPLSEKLVKELVCPKCRGPLEYQEKNKRLVCHTCRVAYSIADDVPVMLIDEAEKVQ